MSNPGIQDCSCVCKGKWKGSVTTNQKLRLLGGNWAHSGDAATARDLSGRGKEVGGIYHDFFPSPDPPPLFVISPVLPLAKSMEPGKCSLL